MRTDYLGNPVSTNADAALAAIDNFVDGFLGVFSSLSRSLVIGGYIPGDI